MKITVLVENTSAHGLPTEHGLSLWIETSGHKLLFDLGQGSLFAENAAALGINVNEAELAVISHGHYDHGGGIANFLSINSLAPVYLHRKAFAEYYSDKDGSPRYIGLDAVQSGRIIYNDGISLISKGLTLFFGADGHEYFSPANQYILKKESGKLLRDDFCHEQSLIIQENGRNILIAGCAHSGILNIMARAESIIGEPLTDVITGMHLMGVDDLEFMNALAQRLKSHHCRYYTCHCTGPEAYAHLKSILGEQITYITCGDVVEI